jgi:hypothetical protein
LGPRPLAPETKGVRREVESSLTSYYHSSGSSVAAGKVLTLAVERARGLVHDLLFPQALVDDDFEIHFLPDRLSSIFAALPPILDKRPIVFLPFFENGIIDEVISWP